MIAVPTLILSVWANTHAAGVIASLLDSGSAFWMILGGALGYFATRLVAAARAAMDARNES